MFWDSVLRVLCFVPCSFFFRLTQFQRIHILRMQKIHLVIAKPIYTTLPLRHFQATFLLFCAAAAAAALLALFLGSGTRNVPKM